MQFLAITSTRRSLPKPVSKLAWLSHLCAQHVHRMFIFKQFELNGVQIGHSRLKNWIFRSRCPDLANQRLVAWIRRSRPKKWIFRTRTPDMIPFRSLWTERLLESIRKTKDWQTNNQSIHQSKPESQQLRLFCGNLPEIPAKCVELVGFQRISNGFPPSASSEQPYYGYRMVI